MMNGVVEGEGQVFNVLVGTFSKIVFKLERAPPGRKLGTVQVELYNFESN